jgi:hypothetical protein
MFQGCGRTLEYLGGASGGLLDSLATASGDGAVPSPSEATTGPAWTVGQPLPFAPLLFQNPHHVLTFE